MLYEKGHPNGTKYAAVMVDEAQDLAEPALGWLRSLRCWRVLVGGAQQDIYSVQQKMNAMTIKDREGVYEVNVSFRLIPPLETLVNNLLGSIGLSCRVIAGRVEQHLPVQNVLVLGRNNSKLLAFLYSVGPYVWSGVKAPCS